MYRSDHGEKRKQLGNLGALGGGGEGSIIGGTDAEVN